MNPLDILMCIILGYCLIMGFFRGFVGEVTALAGVGGGLYLGYTYYEQAAGFLSRWLSDPAYLHILGFMAIFCGCMMTAGLLGFLFRYLIKAAFGAWFDRVSGIGFGAVKGLLFVSILLGVLITFLPEDVPVIRNSLLAPHVARISEALIDMAPPEMKQKFENKSDTFKKRWRQVAGTT
jgi:membrane protein required for colicin V production